MLLDLNGAQRSLVQSLAASRSINARMKQLVLMYVTLTAKNVLLFVQRISKSALLLHLDGWLSILGANLSNGTVHSIVHMMNSNAGTLTATSA